jgi:hypothetical protein
MSCWVTLLTVHNNPIVQACINPLAKLARVRRASRGNGAPQKSRVKAIYSFSKILSLKPHQKSPKNVVNLIDVPEKTTSSFTEASMRYPECCQKLIDAYPDDLNR